MNQSMSCPICGAMISDTEMENHKKTHGEKSTQMTCPTCGATIDSSQMESHKQTHGQSGMAS